MKNAVFWDVTPCGSCKDRRFGGTYLLHLQGDRNLRARNVYLNNNRSTLRRNIIVLYYTVLYYTTLYYSIVFLRSVLRLLVTAKNRGFGGTYRLHHQGDKSW
jgi:hypothetical protein